MSAKKKTVVSANQASTPLSRSGAKAIGAYHHGQLHRMLLEDALSFIQEHGVDALSLRELARRLQVSTAAPYHHFADRDELLRQLATIGFNELLTLMLRECDRAGKDPFKRLRAVGGAYLRFSIEHPAHYQLMFRPQYSPFDHATSGVGGPPFELFRTSVLDCLMAQNCSTHNADQIVLGLWGVVHGIASLWLNDAITAVFSPRNIGQFAESALATVSEGVFMYAMRETVRRDERATVARKRRTAPIATPRRSTK